MVRDLVAYLPARVIGALAGLVAVAALTRVFAPEEYSLWVLFSLASTLYVTLSTAWLGSSTVRFLPACQGDDDVRRLSGRIVLLGLASTAATALAFAGAYRLFAHRLPAAFAPLAHLTLAVIVLQAWTELLLSFLRGLRHAWSFSLFSIWNSLAGLAAGLMLVTHHGYRVDGMLTGTLIAVGLALPVLWGRAVGRPALARDGTAELLAYGLPVLVINVFTWVMSNADRYLVEALAGARAMGIYAANYALAERGVFFLNSMFLLASTPVGFGVWEKQGPDAAREYLARLTRFYLLVAVPATMSLAALAIPLAAVMLDVPYRAGAPLIPIVAAGALLVGVMHRYSIVLSFHKRVGALMFCYLASGVANVALNVALVPRHGYEAAAWATFASYALALALVVALSRSHLAWRFPVASLARITLAAAAMGLVQRMIAARMPDAPLAGLALAVPAGGAVYAALVFALREVTPQELASLRKRAA